MTASAPFDWNTLIGAVRREERAVTPERLASRMESGTLDVLATPCMSALMENAAARLIAPHLPEGATSVGTRIETSHLAPTPAGARFWAEATLLETDGRRFVFRVTAGDETGLIGEGTHERATVKASRFLEKAAARGAAGK